MRAIAAISGVLIGVLAGTMLVSSSTQANEPAEAWRLVGSVTLGPGPLLHSIPESVAGPLGWSPTPQPPSVVAGAGGLVLAAWQGDSGGAIADRGIEPGNLWEATTPLALSSPNSEASTNGTAVALGSRGDALVSWTATAPFPDVEKRLISASALRPVASGSWQPPRTLESAGWPGLESPPAPAIAFDGSGDGFAIWTRPENVAAGEHNGNERAESVQASVKPASSSAWTTPVKISRVRHDIIAPKIAADEAGDAVAVWTYGTYIVGPGHGPCEVVEASVRRGADGRWSTPVVLPHGAEGQVKLVMGPHGSAHVLWQGRSECETEAPPAPLYMAEVSATHDRWRKPTAVPGTARMLEWYGLAISPRGETSVAWQTREYDSKPAELHAVVLPAHAKRWSRPATLARWSLEAPAPDGAPACLASAPPGIAFDRVEEAIATWSHGCEAFASVRSPRSAAWSRPANLAKLIGKQAAPSFALTAQGDLVAIWLEPHVLTEPIPYSQHLTTSVTAALFQPKP